MFETGRNKRWLTPGADQNRCILMRPQSRAQALFGSSLAIWSAVGFLENTFSAAEIIFHFKTSIIVSEDLITLTESSRIFGKDWNGSNVKNHTRWHFSKLAFWSPQPMIQLSWSTWPQIMSGSNICYFVPRRWRVAVFAVVLLMFAYLLLEPMIKSNLPIDVGCEYEIKDVIVTPESLGVGHCPVCFGRNESICEGVIHNTVRLRRKKRASLGDKWKPKALGILNKDRISIKHLGNISEFHKLDNELCSMVGTVNAPCENDVVRKPFLNLSSIER